MLASNYGNDSEELAELNEWSYRDMPGRLLRNVASFVKRVFGIEKPDITTTETSDTPGIKPGDTVDLDGLGDAYSGDYYVDDVSHKTDGEGYETEFDTNESQN